MKIWTLEGMIEFVNFLIFTERGVEGHEHRRCGGGGGGGRLSDTVVLSNHSHSPVDLQRCIQDTSWGHSTPGVLLFLGYLDFQVDPVSPGYQDDHWGPGCLSVLHLASLEVRVVLGVPGCPHQDSLALLSLQMDLCPLVARSGHWCQGNLACRAALALLLGQGGLSYPALQVVQALFAQTLLTGRGSGSGWSYNGINGSG